MKILVFTKYGTDGASSRYRTYQYIPYLQNLGVEIEISELFSNSDLGILYRSGSYGSIRLVKSFLRRMRKLLSVYQYDLIIIEYELFPYFPSIFERILMVCKKKYIVDYDDAIFHNYDLSPNILVRILLKRKIINVIKNAAAVITGNSYLYKYANRWNHNTWLIPTVVEYSRYTKVKYDKLNNEFIIGWVGSPSTSRYLLLLLKVFKLLDPELFRFKFIGADKKIKEYFKDIRIEWLDWDKDNEIKEIKSFSVGIMPLEDSPWSLGKCGFKLIQYMACGIPVIASSVGANKDIVIHGKNGFLAESLKDWYNYFIKLYREKELKDRMGNEGLKLVMDKYSVERTNIQYLEVLSSFIK